MSNRQQYTELEAMITTWVRLALNLDDEGLLLLDLQLQRARRQIYEEIQRRERKSRER